ncbi:MAG: hypothetical protein ACLUIE_10705, partial [Parabacteroides merdae]
VLTKHRSWAKNATVEEGFFISSFNEMPITFLISLVASLQLHLFQFRDRSSKPDEVGPVKRLASLHTLSLERQ